MENINVANNNIYIYIYYSTCIASLLPNDNQSRYNYLVNGYVGDCVVNMLTIYFVECWLTKIKILHYYGKLIIINDLTHLQHFFSTSLRVSIV